MPCGFSLFDSLIGPIQRSKRHTTSNKICDNDVAFLINIKQNLFLNDKVGEKQINEFFTFNGLGKTEKISKPLDLTNFKEKIKFKNVHYKVSLPWKSFQPNLPTNSLGHLKSTLRFFKNKLKLLEKHHKVKP